MEKIIRKQKSLQLNVSFNDYYDGVNLIRNIGIGLEYRVYRKKAVAPVGKYWAFGIGGNILTENPDVNRILETGSLNFKIVRGKQWVVSEHFLLDFNFGAEVVAPFIKVNTIRETNHVDGPLPAFNFGLVYSFQKLTFKPEETDKSSGISKSRRSGSNILKINPAGIIPFRSFAASLISYERAITDKSSVQLNAIANKINLFVHASHLGGGLEYRQYVSNSDTKLEGIYAAAGITAYREKYSDRGSGSETVNNMSAKIILGKQWQSEKFVTDINCGLKYLTEQNETFHQSGHGFLPSLNFGFGYRF